VLKPGGIVRVAVPDLEAIVHSYLRALQRIRRLVSCDTKNKYDWTVIELLDQMTRHRPGGEMFNYWQQCTPLIKRFVEERIGAVPPPSTKYLPDGHPLAEENDAEQVGHFRLSGEAHLWMYDSNSLGRLLRNAGFQDVRERGADWSDIPRFNSYLLDINPDGSVRKPDSLFMEGRK